MIGITTSEAFFLFMTLWLLGLGILWTRALFRRRRFQWSLNDTRLFDCDSCHFAFITRESVNLARCPRCNAICIRRRKKHRGTANRT